MDRFYCYNQKCPYVIEHHAYSSDIYEYPEDEELIAKIGFGKPRPIKCKWCKKKMTRVAETEYSL